jgi:hypothetical protein
MSDPQTIDVNEVPVDGLWHPVRHASTPFFVAARRSDPVELYSWHRGDLGTTWYRVFDTTEPIPEGAQYVKSVVTNGGLYVRHVFSHRNPEEVERAIP